MMADFPQVEIVSRAALRAWLKAHHTQSSSVWLVLWKKGDKRHVPAADVSEEAICFGWIDSVPRKLDAARSMLLLSPRRAKSAWSAINKARAERMIAAGTMTPAGFAKIEEAKRLGLWTKLDAVEALRAPKDLRAAFEAHPGAAAHWKDFPRSVKRGILEWIEQAKRSETRARRILETAQRAAKGERANQWRAPPTSPARGRRPV
jgi:uncharacterized protein YdeI (YjbR/CyaY-like superfamily)